MTKKGANKKNAEKNGGGDASHTKKQDPPAKPAPVPKTATKNPPASKPVKSGSNTGLWMIVLIVTIASGVGFYYFFEEMKRENSVLVEQLHSLKNEIGSLSKANSQLPSVIEAAKSIPELKQSLSSLKSEMVTFQESLSSIQLAVSRAESKLKQNTETVNSKFTNYENDARNFEEGLSEKISLLEKKTSQQMKDMMLHVTESKQLSESLQTTSHELKAGMKFEISDGLKQIRTQVQDNKQSLGNVLTSVGNLELQLTKLESDDSASNVVGLGEELQQMHSEMKESATAFRNLEDFSKESKERLERELSILTSNLRAVKDHVSTVTDDVTALTSSITNIKKTVDVEKERAEKLAAKIDLAQQSGEGSGKSPKN